MTSAQGPSITYKDAGVDIAATDRFVEGLPSIIASTHDGRVLGDLRGFAALYRPDLTGMKEPVLVTTTDGVGTKLRVAIDAGEYSTIGIDLVAMCANDLICCGARPLVFLDYFATARFDELTAREILKGIAAGCREAGLSLVGGETAVMPGMYRGSDFDLAGFAVGIVDRAKILDTTAIAPGDVAIGLASSGLHSNGYSLVRRVIFDEAKLALDAVPEGLARPLAQELLEPTRIYVRHVRTAREARNLGRARSGGEALGVTGAMGATGAMGTMGTKGATGAGDAVKGIAHITGGGLPGNTVRLLPPGCRLKIRTGTWQVPPIFGLVERLGRVPRDIMFETFNMGIGLVLIVPSDAADPILRCFPGESWRIGEVVRGEVGVDVE